MEESGYNKFTPIDSPAIVSRISFLQVPVRNLEESVAWYIEHLGFKVQWKRPDNKMTIMELPSGPEIFLCHQDFHSGAMSVVIGLEVKDISKLLADLRSNGVRIGEVRQNGGTIEYGDIKETLGMDFDFYDPNGNMFVAHAKAVFE